MALVWGDSHRESENARIKKQKLRHQWFARRLELKNKARSVFLETSKKEKVK
ncbi:hypothetical protein ABHN05_12985 [Brevibacillus laterosporus]|uniref:hypothetical protein n=1 Tax=Brevibacillus laterosporus TaxID=1465 RepID=UPI0016515D57|nr:hypothetical protein [Brevibacillus laterosporus]MED4762126.1 hypothetical protein [Brevibacillus laterosporus]